MGATKRKSYSAEFKRNAVLMVTQEGHKTAEVSRNLGISSNMLHNWKRQYLDKQDGAFPGHGKINGKDEYIRRLEQENKRLKDERDILKKAAIFFAKDP
jgi:transposase